MALYQTEAVVLGSKNWGDADKMMTFFTKERGLVRAAAFGCRRPRSPLAGGMQMFSYLDLQLSEGRRVDTVRQCLLRRHYRKLSEDLTAMAYGSFVAEFLREFLPEGQPEPRMFAALLDILDAFERRNPRVTAVAAVYQLMEFTGLQLRYETASTAARRLRETPRSPCMRAACSAGTARRRTPRPSPRNCATSSSACATLTGSAGSCASPQLSLSRRSSCCSPTCRTS